MTKHFHVQRDQADLDALPQRVLNPPDIDKEIRWLYHLLKPKEIPEGKCDIILHQLDEVKTGER